MPYPQDLVGKFVQGTIQDGQPMHPGLNAQVVNGLLTGQANPQTSAVFALRAAAPGAAWARSAPVARPAAATPLIGAARGAAPAPAPAPAAAAVPASAVFNMNRPWTYTFLNYAAGAVTVAPLGGGILTGPMSGCYLFLYTEAVGGGAAGPGRRMVAHVGTVNTASSPASIAAKTAWITFAARPGVTDVIGGSPFDAFSTAEFASAAPGSVPIVGGYFDATGNAFSILCAPTAANRPPLNLPAAMLKVVAVKPLAMQPWGTIAAMRTFRLNPGASQLVTAGVIRLS